MPIDTQYKMCNQKSSFAKSNIHLCLVKYVDSFLTDLQSRYVLENHFLVNKLDYSKVYKYKLRESITFNSDIVYTLTIYFGGLMIIIPHHPTFIQMCSVIY